VKIDFENFTQHFIKDILSRARSNKCAQDLKPRCENQQYLAHALKHKILTRREAL
jgi:hypothetical protein